MELMHPLGSGARVDAPTVMGGRRAALVAAAGSWLVAAICAMVAFRSFSGQGLEPAVLGDHSLGIPVLGAIGITISVARWRPDLAENPLRSVSDRQLLLALFAFVTLAVVSIAIPDLAPTLFGPMVSIGLVGVYLACWGFRSVSLLRRMALLSALAWQPIAEGTFDVVRHSISQSSDLVYRRLSSLPFVHIDQQPWRLFSAMTSRGVLVLVGTALFATIMTRRRLSVGSLSIITIGSFAALVVHHLVIITIPIDQVERTWWVRALTGPAFEIILATTAAFTIVAVARLDRQRADHLATTASIDRDPVIFAVDGQAAPAGLLAICVALTPLAGLLLTIGT